MRIRVGDETIGYDDLGRGTPVVLLHAFPFDRRMWDPLTRRLAHRARLLPMDLRGFGESTGAGTIDDFADDAAHLLDRLGIDRAVVGGCSMGGYASLAFARRHPARLAGLLLVDTRPGADTDEGKANRDRAIALVADRGVEPYAADLVPRLVAPDHAKVREQAVAAAQLADPVAVAAALAAMRDRPDSTPQLASIRAPTLVVVGALDSLTPPAESRKMADAIPGAALVEIPGCGHLAPLEEPERLAAAVETLLDRV